jgi:hypothetical protein
MENFLAGDADKGLELIGVSTCFEDDAIGIGREGVGVCALNASRKSSGHLPLPSRTRTCASVSRSREGSLGRELSLWWSLELDPHALLSSSSARLTRSGMPGSLGRRSLSRDVDSPLLRLLPISSAMEAATELASVRVNDGTSEQEVASVVTVLMVPNLFWLLLLARLRSKMLE